MSKSSGKHKVTYFDVEARAEPVRVLLHAAGVEFDDERLSFGEFGEGKKAGKYATGLPLLTLPDGTEVSQSGGMARYAGKLAGLYPDDPVEALKMDEVIDICMDALGKAPGGKDEAEKKAAREEYAAGRLNSYFQLLDARVAGPFVLGAKLCPADLVVYFFLLKMLRGGQFDHVPATYTDAFPKLTALEAAVADAAPVKAWQEFHAAAAKGK